MNATCLPDYCFCELIREGAVAQPANTWSALAFVLVGIVVLIWALKGKDRQYIYLKALYGVIVIFLGVGTLYFHASLSFVGQLVDNLGMYLLVTLALVYQLRRTRAIHTVQKTIAVYIGANAVLIGVVFALPALRRPVFAALIIAFLYLEYRWHRKHPKWRKSMLYWSVGLTAAGFTLWTLDITGVLCSPTSILQGHAAWHILTALAAGVLYLHLFQDHNTS